MRAGTENVAGAVGMSAALVGNCREIERSREHLLRLENILLGTLRPAGSTSSATAMNVPDEYAPGTVRVSFGKHNTGDDTATTAEALAGIIPTQ